MSKVVKIYLGAVGRPWICVKLLNCWISNSSWSRCNRIFMIRINYSYSYETYDSCDMSHIIWVIWPKKWKSFLVFEFEKIINSIENADLAAFNFETSFEYSFQRLNQCQYLQKFKHLWIKFFKMIKWFKSSGTQRRPSTRAGP